MKTLLIVVLMVVIVGAFLSRARADGVSGVVLEKIRNGAALVDVRTPGEYAAGHIEGALNIPHDRIAERAPELGADKGKSFVLYCRSGRRAAFALEALQGVGYTNAVNGGGYEALKKALAGAPAAESKPSR
jgi:phage shock protein E